MPTTYSRLLCVAGLLIQRVGGARQDLFKRELWGCWCDRNLCLAPNKAVGLPLEAHGGDALEALKPLWGAGTKKCHTVGLKTIFSYI